MRPEILFRAMKLYWPAWQASERDFCATWAEEIRHVKDESGASAVKEHARRNPWPPSLAEFLSLVGGGMRLGYRGTAERPMACRNGCGLVLADEGAEAIHAAPGGPCSKAPKPRTAHSPSTSESENF